MNYKSETPTAEDCDFRSLINEIKTGHKPTEALLENPTFIRRVRLICQTLEKNSADGDELFNDVGTKVWRGFSQFSPDDSKPYANFFAWVREIARNTFFDRVRRKSLDYVDTPSDEQLHITAQIDLEDEYLEREFEVSLKRYVNGLPDNRHRLAVEYFLAGLTFREIEVQMAKHGIENTHVTFRYWIRDALKTFFTARKVDQQAWARTTKAVAPIKKTGS